MKFINLHTHNVSSAKNNLEIINYDFNLKIVSDFFSIGIHPWFLKNDNYTQQLEKIKRTLGQKNCLALGECGLDKNIEVDFEFQKLVFIKQLEINKQFNKPTIIHCVKSFQEIILIKKAYCFPFIIHGFNKKLELAEQLIDNRFYLSFGKSLLEKESLQHTFKNLPLENLFLETDDSKNTIEEIYKKAAEIKEIPLENLILALESNFKKIFNE